MSETPEEHLAWLMQRYEAAQMLWRDVADNHPTYNNVLNASRAVDRFLDTHPELMRPEDDERLRAEARELIESDRGGYGDGAAISVG